MKILYFGIYNSESGRNKIYISGLKQLGHTVIECQDNSSGVLKYWRLWRKHRKIKNDYDFLIVGYPGHLVVWLAKLLSRKLVVFDALCTMEEGVLISRGQYGRLGINGLYIKFIDWLAVKSADTVLVESMAQQKFYEVKFGMSDKYKVIYTGADSASFFKDEFIKKRDKFTILFRGKFLPEAGVKHIINAAKILKNEDINFVIIGNGFLEKEIKAQVEKLNLNNLSLVTITLSSNELREQMQSCHVSLGQFEYHPRLLRTIPHKCFESLAMGLPYLTAKTEPICEILKENESVLFAKAADPDDLAQKILMLKNDAILAEKIGENGSKIFQNKFTPKDLAAQILNLQK